MLCEEMDRRIKSLIEDEFRYWEMSAKAERVIGQTLVNYYLPDEIQEPDALYWVKQRGFRQVLFCDRLEAVRQSSADVVIVDFQALFKGAGGR
jgi:hypothetical protein